MSLTSQPAIWLIQLYQRLISPYKGFRCAHTTLYKGDSCSYAVIKIIQKHGLWSGRDLITQRFQACNDAYKTLQQQAKAEYDTLSRSEQRDKECNQSCDRSCEIATTLSDVSCCLLCSFS